jgi:CRISP-associated protein Cas1
MRRHLNTLFVTTPGTYLAKDGETALARVEGEVKLRVPILSLGSIVCFGQVSVSPALLGLCGERGVAVSYLTKHGRFLARVVGPVSGNVLLRREQYRRADNEGGAARIARSIVAAKIANSRAVLLRALRDRPEGPDTSTVETKQPRRTWGISFDNSNRASRLMCAAESKGQPHGHTSRCSTT